MYCIWFYLNEGGYLTIYFNNIFLPINLHAQVHINSYYTLKLYFLIKTTLLKLYFYAQISQYCTNSMDIFLFYCFVEDCKEW